MENFTLEITDIKFTPVKSKANIDTLAFCTVVFNNALIVAGIKVRNGKKGIYVTMPVNTAADGRRWPLVYPATGEARSKIAAHILANYALTHAPVAGSVTVINEAAE